MDTPEKFCFNTPQVVQIGELDLTIKKEIGTGGFGSVFLAEYKGIDYALKIYRMWEIGPNERADLLKRIKQEYVISDSISSPNVVKIFSYQEYKGNPVLIMQYCNGGSLQDSIGKQFTEEQIRLAIKDICTGLMAMHEQGIIHRDIKPENILIKNETYFVTDFGISVSLKNRLTKRDIMGHVKQIFATAAYSPPEQIDGSVAFKKTGITNDVFALGVMLYELVTLGQLPYGSIDQYKSNPHAYEERKQKELWDRQQLEQFSVHPLWKEIITKCLRADPSQRFQNLKEILDIMDPVEDQVKPDRQQQVTLNKAFNWRLRVVEGDQKGLIFYISNLSKNKNKRRLTIGRLFENSFIDNDILIMESGEIYISRYHATLEQFIDPTGLQLWFIRDGQWVDSNGSADWHLSKNGVLVNNTPIDQHGFPLRNGDIIKLGKARLMVEADE